MKAAAIRVVFVSAASSIGYVEWRKGRVKEGRQCCIGFGQRRQL